MSDEPVAPKEGQPQETSVWDNPSLGKFKSPEGTYEHDKLAKSYLELESMVGKRVPVPTKESPDEEWDKFFDRIAPKDASEYQLELPGVDDVNAEELAEWRREFHKAKLVPKQAQHIMNMLAKSVVADQTRTKQANQELERETANTLKEQWGPNYEGNKELVKASLRELGGDDLVATFAPLLNNNVAGAKFLYDVAKELRTSPILKDQGLGNFGLMTNDEAMREKADIMKNPENPLYHSYHDKGSFEKRKPAIDRINQLNSILTNSPAFRG